MPRLPELVMRPHKLRFAAIGPYPQEVEVDFDDLGSLGLYTILGPTGSGKSTIFDAMTVALYGELPGDNREIKAFVTTNSDRLASPFVELEFTQRNVLYRIRRVPPYNELREGGTVKEHKHKATLEILGQDNSESDENLTNLKEIKEKIESVIGLNAKQFDRVILLPQGEFQKFLFADKKEKKSLLGSLLGTETYRKIAESFQNTVLEMERELEGNRIDIDLARDRIKQNLEDIAVEAPAEQSGKLLDPDVPIDKKIEIVEKIRKRKIAEQKKKKDQVKKINKEIIAGEKNRELSEFHDSRDVLIVERGKNSGKEDLARDENDKHEKAKPIIEEFEEAKNSKSELDKCKEKRKEKEEEIRSALEGEVPPVMKDLSESDLPTQELFLEIRNKHNAEKGKAEELLTLEQYRKNKETERDKCGTELEKIQEEEEEAEAEKAKLNEQIEQLLRLESSQQALEIQVRDIDQKIEKSDVNKINDLLTISSEKCEELKREFDKAERKVQSAIAAVQGLVITELVNDLVDGVPCPVCGATDHPEPANTDQDGEISADLQELLNKRNEIDEKKKSEEKIFADLTEKLEEAARTQEELPPQSEIDSLRQELEAATSARKKIDAKESKKRGLETKLEGLTSDKVEKGKEEIRIKEELTETKGKITDREESFVAIYDDPLPEDMGSYLAGIDIRLQDLELLLDQMKDLNEGISENATRLDEVTKRAERLVAGSDFASANEARGAVLPEDKLNENSYIITVAEERDAAINGIEAQINGKPRPGESQILDEDQIRELKVVIEDLEEKADDLGKAAVKLELKLESLKRDNQRVLNPEIGELEDQFTVLNDVQKRMRLPTEGQFDLETWVIRRDFEEICELASKILLKISQNRYEITLRPPRTNTEKSPSGLDLYVFDGHTGQARSVKTLSGGEQFLTSLALANALAEVIQQKSGGVEISTLFIDEGFGTLDSDTLEIAIETLRTMQSDGRTVGVISHVEQLQNELPTGIRVSKGVSGSSIRSYPNL